MASTTKKAHVPPSSNANLPPPGQRMRRDEAALKVLQHLARHGPTGATALKQVAPYGQYSEIKKLLLGAGLLSKAPNGGAWEISPKGRAAAEQGTLSGTTGNGNAAPVTPRIPMAPATKGALGVRDPAYTQPARPATLPAEEADQSHYSPEEGDRRKIVERQIRERRGQKPFRDALRKRYGNRCMVTDCQLLDVLEAAHILPYRGDNDHHPENGLLLRADIHTLFDLDLLRIEPDHLRIELHPDLAKSTEYANLQGQPLRCPPNRRPSSDALRIRYEQFQNRSRSPA